MHSKCENLGNPLSSQDGASESCPFCSSPWGEKITRLFKYTGSLLLDFSCMSGKLVTKYF